MTEPDRNIADDLALLTQRSYEAEEAWRRMEAAEKAWRQARQNLRAAWDRVRPHIEE